MPRTSHLLLQLLLLLSGATLAAQEDTALRPDEQLSGPQPVYTGIYLMNLYDLDINAYSYYADFYIWFKWKGELDPMNIEFVNAIEKWGFTMEPFHDTAKILTDGYAYNGMRVEGRFYHAFELNRFPLEKHVLDLRIENIEYDLNQMMFLPDTQDHLIRSDLTLPGWHVEEATMKTHDNFYETDFGEGKEGQSNFSNFTFQLQLSRPLTYFGFKLMLPLTIVIIASLGALFIIPGFVDARISLPIGGLLTAVFLQQSYESALPDVGYMVLMDKIYLAAYLLIACVMARVILTANRNNADNFDRMKAKKSDRRLALRLFAGFWIVSAVVIAVS